MKYYSEGVGIEIAFRFTDKDEKPVKPTEITALLYDGEDQLITDFGSLPFEETDTEKTIFISSELNRLSNGELQAARILHIQLTTESGIIRRFFSYAIEAEQRLIIMNNTFQTYEAALIETRNMPNMTGWLTGSEEQQKAALVEAYKRLTMIPMRFNHRDPDGKPLPRDYIILANAWGDVTRDEFDGFPTHFRRALRRAQLIESNELLQGDTISRKRRNGIVTEKIGESWLTLSAGKLDYGLSNQTLTALTGYIYYRATIARA